MISKGARAETWSLTPQVVIDVVIPYAFDNIIQHTASNLREISLNVLRECPQIIRHLADHCPKLRVLKMIVTILETFDVLVPDLARLVDRLTTLVLEPASTANFLTSNVELSKQLLTNFKTLFQLLQHPESLTHLELPFAPTNSESIQVVRSALGRLANLTFIYVPLDMTLGESGLIFSDSRSLQCIEMNSFADVDTLEVFAPTLLRALSQSPIGDRIVFKIFPHFPPASFFERVMELDGGRDPQRFFGWLNESGFVGPLSGETISLLLAAVHVSKLPEVLDMLESEQRPCWLPHLRDVIDHVHRSSFWICLIRGNPTEVIRSVIMRLGMPPVQMSSRMIFAALQSGEVQTLQYFEELGLMNRENMMSLDPKSIFCFAENMGTFQFVRSRLSNEDARTLLLEHSTGDHSAFVEYLLMHHNSIVDACLERDPTLLCLTTDADFVVTAHFLSRNPTKRGNIQRLVEATGLNHISAAARAACLWDSTVQWFSEETPFWINLIESDPEVEPNFLAQIASDIACCGLNYALEHDATGRNLFVLAAVMKRFQEPLLRHILNLAMVDTATDLVPALFLFLCRFRCAVVQKRIGDAEQQQLFDHIVSTFFIPCCRKAAHQRGGCPTARVISVCWRASADELLEDDIRAVLLAECASVDNMASGVRQIAESLRDFFSKPDKGREQLLCRCAELIVDYVEAASLNKLDNRSKPPKNLMDHILSPGVASRLKSKSEIIHKLVQRGGRVSFPETQQYSHAQVLHDMYDIEGIELYFEAVRTAQARRLR
jgi:hypothetical protein